MTEHYVHSGDFYDQRGNRHRHARVVDIDDDHHRSMHDTTDGCPVCDDYTRAADDELETTLAEWRRLEDDMHAAFNAFRPGKPWGCILTQLIRLMKVR